MSLRKWILIFFIFFGFILILPYLFSIFPLKQLFEYQVGKKYNSKIQIEKINLSWLGPQIYKSISIKSPSFDGHIQKIQSNTPFWNLTSNKIISIENGSFQVHTDSISTEIENLNANIHESQIQAQATTKKDGQSGNIYVHGTIESPENFDLSVQAKFVPTILIDQYLKKDNLLLALIGPSFNLNFNSHMKNAAGSAKFNLQSTQLQLAGNIALTPQTITLLEPLYLSGKLSESLSPHLPYGITSYEQVSLQIDPNGFSIPRSLSISEMQIKNATLNLGKLHLKQASFLDQPLSFFKTPKLANHEADIWLNAFRFSFENQKIKYGRVDFLINSSLHLCSWGKIDSNSKKLDLILGVPSDTLAKSFYLTNIPSDTVLQIPVSGTFENPKISTKNAAKTIATLLASDQLKKGGGIFKGIGQIIDQSQKESAPKPNLPFPWE